MTLDKVSSLADLEFRVKSNKYYKQLAILGAKRCCGSSVKLKEIKTYEQAIAFLHDVSIKHNPNSCSAVVQEVNACCTKIVEEVEPTPPTAEGTPTPTPIVTHSDKLKAMVDQLKKKAVSKKRPKATRPTARGARSSSRSRTPTPSTRARSTRRSNASGRNT